MLKHAFDWRKPNAQTNIPGRTECLVLAISTKITVGDSRAITREIFADRESPAIE